MNKLLFRVNGGLGKNICATAVVKQIKQKYPDSILHVQASYPDIFVNMPEIEEVYPYPNPIPNFYKYHKDFDIIETEPYVDLVYRQGKEHVINTWCRKLGLNQPEKLKGIINLDESEIQFGKNFLNSTKFNGPLIAFQYIGGTPFGTPENANDPLRIKHTRDLQYSLAQEIVDKLVKHGFGFLQISLPTERRLNNCFQLPDNLVMNPRYVFAILNQCKFGIFIDSFAQHSWVALNKKNALVLWGGTNPTSLGYSENLNLFEKENCQNIFCNRPDTFMFDYQGNGNLWKCPNGQKCMQFNSEKVIQAFLSIAQKELQQCEKSC
jgi:hypothetical protein